MPDVVGLDLSLRSAAAVALPIDFHDGLRWDRVRHVSSGYPLPKTASELQRAGRIRTVRDDVLTFVRGTDATEVWMEEMAFSRSGAMAREIAGMTWVVRLVLMDAGYTLRVVTASAARKVFLGHARKGAKQLAQQALSDIGAPFADCDDTCDAFVIANYAASELGGRALMLGEVAA